MENDRGVKKRVGAAAAAVLVIVLAWIAVDRMACHGPQPQEQPVPGAATRTTIAPPATAPAR